MKNRYDSICGIKLQGSLGLALGLRGFCDTFYYFTFRLEHFYHDVGDLIC